MNQDIDYLDFTNDMGEDELEAFEDWLVEHDHEDLVYAPFPKLFLSQWRSLYQDFLESD